MVWVGCHTAAGLIKLRQLKRRFRCLLVRLGILLEGLEAGNALLKLVLRYERCAVCDDLLAIGTRIGRNRIGSLIASGNADRQ